MGEKDAQTGGASSGEERLTEDLLERLLVAASPEAYLDAEGIEGNREFVDYLFERLGERGGKRAAVVRESGLNPTVVYDIFQGKSRPGRDHAIMLAFGLHCDLRQTSGSCAWPASPSCGASSGATPSSSGASTTAAPASRPTMSSFALARRPCSTPAAFASWDKEDRSLCPTRRVLLADSADN